METPAKRIDYLIKHYGMSYNSFAKSIGMANGTGIKTMVDKDRTPQQNTLNRISTAYPEVNIHWIRTGVGQMLSEIKEEVKSSISKDEVAGAFLEAKQYTEKIYNEILRRLDEDRLHYVEARDQMNRDLRKELSLLSEKIKNEDRLYFDKKNDKRLEAVLDQFIAMKKEIGEYASSGTHKITEKIDKALNENAKLTAVAIEKILRMEQDLETITLVLASEYELDKTKANQKKTNGKQKAK